MNSLSPIRVSSPKSKTRPRLPLVVNKVTQALALWRAGFMRSKLRVPNGKRNRHVSLDAYVNSPDKESTRVLLAGAPDFVSTLIDVRNRIEELENQEKVLSQTLADEGRAAFRNALAGGEHVSTFVLTSPETGQNVKVVINGHYRRFKTESIDGFRERLGDYTDDFVMHETKVKVKSSVSMAALRDAFDKGWEEFAGMLEVSEELRFVSNVAGVATERHHSMGEEVRCHLYDLMAEAARTPSIRTK